MTKKGRKHRRIEWERIMRKQAWTAQELAPKLNLSPFVTRRYLRIAYNGRRVERKRFGVLWYYVIRRFLSPANHTYHCPVCSAKMEVFIVRCGCEFHICSVDGKHDIYRYCERHRVETPPRCPKCKEQMELSWVGDAYKCPKCGMLLPRGVIVVTVSQRSVAKGGETP